MKNKKTAMQDILQRADYLIKNPKENPLTKDWNVNYVDNSSLMEVLSDIAHDLVFNKYGDDCWVDCESEVLKYKDYVQDDFDNYYQSIELLLENKLNIVSDIRKNKL